MIPGLIDRFNGYKSSEWIKKFVYLLFNCAILDEYMLKKNCPTKTRVSFVNILAGNDVDKVLKRVSNELENMMQSYCKYGNANQSLTNNNAKSWLECNDLMFCNNDNSNRRQSMTQNVSNTTNKNGTIQYNFQYILCAVYPLHLLLFWMYFVFNNNDNFNYNVSSFIIIGLAQFVFCILSGSVIFVPLYNISPLCFANCINSKLYTV